MNTKRKFKAGLYFGICMTFFYLINLFLDHRPESAAEISKAVFVGIIGGILSGILFGWSSGFLIKPGLNKAAGTIEMNPGEALLFETAANHFQGFRTKGGQLLLSNQRLIFTDHQSKDEKTGFSILRRDIKSVNRYRILGIVNKGLSIVTNKEKIEKFEVLKAEEWDRLLNNK